MAALFLCAPARIRTQNNGSEDRCDIHFTTGAKCKCQYTLSCYENQYRYVIIHLMTENFSIPSNVTRVVQTLHEHNFDAYLVGGCVRDLVLNREPKDWDITTNATPEQMIPLFEKAVHENDFGTVAIVFEDEPLDSPVRTIEATTYRMETTYSNNRHPDSIEYATKLEDDLMRRDFTMNAMAFDPIKKELIDNYNGQADMESKMITAVGNAHDRFQEDALRMLRAVRFSAQLEFRVSRETHDAIENHADLLKNISGERIRDEFSKLIDSPHPEHGMQVARETGLLQHFLPEMMEGCQVEQDRDHIYDVWTHLIKSAQYGAEQDFPFHVKLAALFHDIGKPRTKGYDDKQGVATFYGHEVVGARMVKNIMKRLKFSKDISQKVEKLVRWHMFFVDVEQITLSAVRRMVANVGEELIWDLMKLRQCDRKGMGRPKAEPYNLRKYKSMIEEALRDPVSVKQLKINGDYMVGEMQMKPGPRMGWMLHALLEEVLDDPAKNTLEYLEERVKDLDELEDDALRSLGEKGKEKQRIEDEKELEQIRKKHHVK